MGFLVKKQLFIMLCVMACFFLVSAASKSVKTKTYIGILNPEISGGDARFMEEVAGALKKNISEMGMYDIYTQQAMEKAFTDKKMRFPGYCREPECVSALGSVLHIDRMLYGSVDKGEKTYGVKLTLVDVPSRKIIETVSIEGEPGVTLNDIIRVTVNKLHGYTDPELDTLYHTYFGRQVKNSKQFYISSGVCLLTGLAWTMINSASVKKRTLPVEDEIDYSNWEKSNTGIGTGADRIPLCGRPASLGNAYVAASDDAYGVFFNPAGLSWAPTGECAFGYQSRFGLNNFAASFTGKATRDIGFGEGFIYSGDNEGLFSEVFFISAVSYKVNDLFKNIFPFLRPFSVGAAVRIASKKTGKTEVSESSISGSATGIGLNLGMQLEVSDKIRGGILVRNVPSILKWNNASTGKKYNENEPVELLMGGTFQANYATFLICEGHIPLYKDQLWKGACGIERLIFRVIKIRVGVEKSEGLETPWKVNCGLGLNLRTESLFGKYLLLDGSYEYNQESMFSNVLNFSFRFGF